ncbi:DUF2267 domain-containing protein [Longibacter sp.]|uniref:DUF2267 domain-containing protein n=1 Tax=Longibacter sp. TaxID=2045415 RepID=UPI003EB7C3B7
MSAAMGDGRRRAAYHALRGAILVLRDRPPVEDGLDLSSQLPLLIRGLFFEANHPTGESEKLGRDDPQ